MSRSSVAMIVMAVVAIGMTGGGGSLSPAITTSDQNETRMWPSLDEINHRCTTEWPCGNECLNDAGCLSDCICLEGYCQ